VLIELPERVRRFIIRPNTRILGGMSQRHLIACLEQPVVSSV
jgi:hypothetical protein